MYVLDAKRIPFCKSFSQYTGVSNQTLMTHTLNTLVSSAKLQNERIGDVALGGVMMSPADWNLARECVLGTELSADTPAYNVQRACGTSVETAWQLSLKIRQGQISSAIAGGVDTNSDFQATFPKSFTKKMLQVQGAKTLGARIAAFSKIGLADLKPQFPGVVEPRTGLTMGQHTELMVKEWNVGRQEQDQLSYESHIKGARAYKEGFYDDLVTEFMGIQKDLILRGDTTLEKLASLKPAFDKSGKGTLTAGNSTALTDGASAILLGNMEFAKSKKLEPWAELVDFEVAAVNFVGGAGLLIAPAIAVSRMLQRANRSLQDFDYYEIHEAFAGQVLCTLKAWEDPEYCRVTLGRDKPMGSIDRDKMNVKGGSVAIGHPFAATGARIIGSLAKALRGNPNKYGLISVCTAGGMGITAIVKGV